MVYSLENFHIHLSESPTIGKRIFNIDLLIRKVMFRLRWCLRDVFSVRKNDEENFEFVKILRPLK